MDDINVNDPIIGVNYNMQPLSVEDSKSLKLPDVAPTTQQLVSIDADGAQQNLNIGDGLTVANGVVSAGDKLYRHEIRCKKSYWNWCALIYNRSSELMTVDVLYNWLTNNGFSEYWSPYPVSYMPTSRHTYNTVFNNLDFINGITPESGQITMQIDRVDFTTTADGAIIISHSALSVGVSTSDITDTVTEV